MINPQRGDVVLVLFPNSDLKTAKRRPALVLRRDNLDSGLPQTIFAMISMQSVPTRTSQPHFRGRDFGGRPGGWFAAGFSHYDGQRGDGFRD